MKSANPPHGGFLGALLVYSVSLSGLAAAAAELARFDAESSVQAADTGLTLLLVSLMPLSVALSLVRFEPLPEGLTITLGQSRRRVLLVRWIALGGTMGALAMALTAGMLLWTRTLRDPDLAMDLSVSLPIAFGATLATLSLFAAARAWGGRLGLLAVLVLSWTLGQSDIVASALLPAGHTRHLLGVGEPLPLSPSLSAGCLAAFAVVFLGGLLLRAPR